MVTARKPTFHVIALHHTIVSDQFSACAFTGKVLRLPDVLHAAYLDGEGSRPGCTVVEYGVEGSESDADEHVIVRTIDDLCEGFGSVEAARRHYAQNCNNPESIKEFEEDLNPHLRRRVRPGDFILHPFGRTHEGLLRRFQDAIHVESGIGYVSGGFGAYRIFESEAWRNWHAGRQQGTECAGAVGNGGPDDLANQFVAPNYYDPEYWTFGAAPSEGRQDRDPYVLFAGRPDSTKGIGLVAELARRMPDVRFKIAGTPSPMLTELFSGPLPNVELLGVVQGRDRVPLYGGALCMVMPTTYFEPFGGSCAEAMLTGTPVLAPPVGCFAERPILPAVKVSDYEGQIRALLELQQSTNGRMAYHGARQNARAFASECYSIQAAAAAYRIAFDALAVRP